MYTTALQSYTLGLNYQNTIWTETILTNNIRKKYINDNERKKK